MINLHHLKVGIRSFLYDHFSPLLVDTDTFIFGTWRYRYLHFHCIWIFFIILVTETKWICVIVGLVHLEKKYFLQLYSHLIMSIKMHFTSFCDTVHFFALWYFIFNLIICSIAAAQYCNHKTFSCNVKNPLVIVMPINLVTVLKLKLSFLNWVSLTLWVFYKSEMCCDLYSKVTHNVINVNKQTMHSPYTSVLVKNDKDAVAIA